MKHRIPFQKRYSDDERQSMSKGILTKRAGSIPTIVQPADDNAPPLEKERFLLPADLTGGQLQYILRRRMASLRKEQALFLFCNRCLVSSTVLIGDLFHAHRESDGFLYLYYGLENTFG